MKAKGPLGYTHTHTDTHAPNTGPGWEDVVSVSVAAAGAVDIGTEYSTLSVNS